jgi:hypothetical protein
VTLRRAVPILLFAATIALLQWISTGTVTTLPLLACAVFFATTILVRLVPWAKAAAAAPPQSRLFPAVLFLLFIRHFVGIVSEEVTRVLAARRLCIARRYGPGWFSSLVWALAGVFRASLARAERFYAALLLGGWAS